MHVATKNETYLLKALSKLHFLETNLSKLLDPVTGLIFDGTHGYDLSSQFYTYNQGVLMHVYHLLFNATKDMKYMEKALKLA